MKQITTLIFSILLVGLSSHSFSQQAKYYVDVEISNNTPSQHEEIELTYKLKYRGNSIRLSNPQYKIADPNFGGGFNVLRKGGNGGMSMDFNMGGGGMTIYTYTYIIKPKATGNFTIGPMSITFEGKKYTSKSQTRLC